MICAACDASNPDGNRFCAGCGAALAPGCPSCGHANPPDHRFCGGCGSALESAARVANVVVRSPRDYTPKHLADKILQSKSALEGVHRFEGTINQCTGDGIMALFGAP